jgi:putative inorganic carbon (HCO3(-)) transporter
MKPLDSISIRPDGAVKPAPIGEWGVEWVIVIVAVVTAALVVTDPTFVLAGLCVGLAIAVICRFDLFIYGLIFLLPWYPLLDVNFPIRDVLLISRFILLAGVWVLRRRQGKSISQWILGSTLRKLVLIFAGVMLISLLFSSVRANLDAYRSLLRLFSYLAVFFALVGWLENRRQIVVIIKVLLASTICVAIFGFFQVIQDGYTDLYFHLYPLQEDALEPWAGRITSFLFHFNSLAGYLNLVLPFSIGCMVLVQDRWLRILGMVCHTTAFAALFFTGSRGGLLAYGGTVLLSVLCFGPRRVVFFRVSLSIVLAMVIVLSLLPRYGGASSAGGSSDRLLDVDEFTQISRLALWGAAVAMFLAHPILGVGYGNYRSLYNDYIPGTAPGQLDAHNIYLQFLSETGIVGFVAFFVLIGGFARVTLSLVRRSDPFYRLVGFGVGGALIATLIHGMVDFLFNVSPQFGVLFWTVLALGMAASENLSGKVEEASAAKPVTSGALR